MVFQSRDEYCNECCDKNRCEATLEFKCVFENRFEGCFGYGFEY